MTKAAIYSRFSTDLQSERSIDDQVALCRSYAAREGLDVVSVYDDRARSGGSIMGRDGLLRLLDDAKRGKFEVLIVEALDRLSRDMEDLAGIHKRLTFLGIEIRAVHEGAVTTVLVGLRGLIGQLYREDNAHKIRRGMAGRIRSALSAGGITYGYAAVPGHPGRRAIVEPEAAVVRRIFAEYVAGATPRDIAHGLNRDRVPPPRGSSWNASTITGHRQRGTGILRNQMYVGRLVWGRARMIRDPDTGRRLSRPSTAGEPISAEAPELAIVERDVFDAAQARQRDRGAGRPERHRRPKRLLSGLLRCGACGSGMSSQGRDPSGRVRLRCTAHHEAGTCPDPRTFYLDVIERAVLHGLADQMRDPKAITEYVRAYHEERQRLAARAVSDRATIERRLAQIDREAEHCIDMLVKGIGSQERIGARSRELETEERELRARLAEIDPAPAIVTLHPRVLARYEQQLERLAEALGRAVGDGDADAARVIRELVESVTVFRDGTRRGGVMIEISGRLAPLLGDRAYPNGLVTAVGGSLVAEERCRRNPHMGYVLRFCA